ncbi:TPA: hypothetical protein ACKP8W_000395 [Stenotrophomonas maltophilia]
MADAQEFVSSERTYDERLRGARVAALGDDLFGDSLNRKDGTLQFSQTDVVVPTSSGMRVAFTRTTPKQKQGLDRAAAPLGASWEIDAPYMMGSYDQRRGWNAAGGGRCSGSNLSPTEWVGPSPDFNTRVIPKHTYWSGIFINLPAVGYESLLLKEAGASLPQGWGNLHWHLGQPVARQLPASHQEWNRRRFCGADHRWHPLLLRLDGGPRPARRAGQRVLS